MPGAEKQKERGAAIRVFLAHPDGTPNVSRLKRLTRRVVDEESWTFALSIIIADDPELRRLNRLFFNSDEATDVIAFPHDSTESEREGEESENEIYINLDQARVQALGFGETVQKALERLLVHGILHLGGWRDNTDAQRERMLKYGERYLSAPKLGG